MHWFHTVLCVYLYNKFFCSTFKDVSESKRNFNTVEFLTRRSKWDAPRYRAVSQKCRRAVFLCPTQGKKDVKKNCIFGRFSSITADPLVISKWNFNTAEFLTRRSKWDTPRYRTVSRKCRRAVLFSNCNFDIQGSPSNCCLYSFGYEVTKPAGHYFTSY